TSTPGARTPNATRTSSSPAWQSSATRYPSNPLKPPDPATPRPDTARGHRPGFAAARPAEVQFPLSRRPGPAVHPPLPPRPGPRPRADLHARLPLPRPARAPVHPRPADHQLRRTAHRETRQSHARPAPGLRTSRRTSPPHHPVASNYPGARHPLNDITPGQRHSILTKIKQVRLSAAAVRGAARPAGLPRLCAWLAWARVLSAEGGHSSLGRELARA